MATGGGQADGWELHQLPDDVHAVVPTWDVFQHDPGPECLCGPDRTVVSDKDGMLGVLLRHHPLSMTDGGGDGGERQQ